MNGARWVVALALAMRMGLVPLAAQERDVRRELAERGAPAAFADPVLAQVEATRAAGLPAGPVADKALEGWAKHVPMQRVVMALEQLRTRLEAGRAALAVPGRPTPPEPVVTAAAEALANDPNEGHAMLKDGATLKDILVRRAVVYGLARVDEPWALELLQTLQVEDDQWIVRTAATEVLDSMNPPIDPRVPFDAPELLATTKQPALVGRLDLSPNAGSIDWKGTGLAVAGRVVQRVAKLNPKFILGKGKLADLEVQALRGNADVVLFDQDLSPAQMRNLGEITERKVLDRTQLILDIFAQRAKSRDGKLQVELAQLKYSLPRLTDKDAGLSRLTGGIGGRGPGETVMEVGRRRLNDRIRALERQVEQLSKQRDLRRRRRREEAIPILSIIGYTNAGKSTLLNALTRSEVEAADQLFMTLDPTSRRLRFPREGDVVVTDTVGFISELPRDLLAAFHATLEELADADLLLHVIDVAPEYGLYGVPLVIPAENLDAAKEWTETALERLVKGVGEKVLQPTKVLAGRPAERILATEKEIAPDLTIIGTHGRHGLDRLMLGSVAERVVQRATGPVLVVPTRK